MVHFLKKLTLGVDLKNIWCYNIVKVYWEKYVMIREEISDNIIQQTQLLKENKNKQRDLSRHFDCIEIPYNQFVVGGDTNIGNVMFNNVARLALENFNRSCEDYIDKLSLSNIEDIIIKIQNEYNNINEKLDVFDMRIIEQYLSLKIEQCHLQETLLFYKQQRKEIEQTEREIIKEQLKEEKRIQKEKEKLEKERIALQYKFNKELEQTGIQNGNLQRDIDNLDAQIEQRDYALTHNRAGYVYVVSNDDMKEGQYKIGITRRSVEERMNELGTGASHSFPMNIHGYVYCDDCFEVESALHRHFANQRVNQVNPRKEWFKTTLTDIKQAFKTLFDIDIILTDVSDENYLYSKEKIKI